MLTSKQCSYFISLLLVIVHFLTLTMGWREQEIGWQEYIQQNRPPRIDEKGRLDFRYLKPDDRRAADQIRLTSVDFSHLSEEEREKVTILDLRYNRLATIPPEIKTLKNLEVLYLASNQLVELPEEIGELSKLVCLDVSSNKLTKLTSAIGKLSNLAQLDLFGNQLRTLPPEIGQLSQLQVLDPLKNPFLSLPPTYSKVVHCWHLNIPTDTERLQQVYRENIRRFILQAIRDNNLVKIRKFTRSICARCELDPKSFQDEHGNNLLQVAIMYHDPEKDSEGKMIKELIACGIPLPHTDLIALLGKNVALFTDVYNKIWPKEDAERSTS